MRLVYVAIVLVCAAGLAPVHAQLDLRFSYPGFHKFCSGASVIAYPPDPKGIFPPPLAAALCPPSKPYNAVCDNLGFKSVREGQCVYAIRDQQEGQTFSMNGLVIQKDDGSDLPDILSGVELKVRLRIYTFFTDVLYRGILRAPFSLFVAAPVSIDLAEGLPDDLSSAIYFSEWSSTGVTVTAVLSGVADLAISGVHVRRLAPDKGACTSSCTGVCCDFPVQDFSGTAFPLCLSDVMFDAKTQAVIFPSCPTIPAGQVVTISAKWSASTPSTAFSTPFNATWLGLINTPPPAANVAPRLHAGALYVSVFYGEDRNNEVRAVVTDDSILSAKTGISKDDSRRNFAAEVVGRLSYVNHFLNFSEFVPFPLFNNVRVLSPCLDGKRNSGPLSTQSTELIDLRVVQGVNAVNNPFPVYDAFNDTMVNSFNSRFPFAPPLNTLRFMVRFIPQNNAPVFETPSTTFPAPGSLELDFGKNYVFEGGGSLVTLTGVVISDADMFENCYSLAECQIRALDANIGCQRGSVKLNSLTGINVYSAPGSAFIGFTAPLAVLNAAIRSLVYDIGARAASDPSVAVFNTQRLALDAAEAVTVIVLDQGFYGLSQVASTSRIDIPITVVARNTAPAAVASKSGLFVNCVEDEPVEFSGPVVSDVDIEDKTLSSYAEREWLNSAPFIGLKNKMSLTITSVYGKLFLPFIRDVDVSSTDNFYAFSIGNMHPDSDALSIFETFPTLITKIAGSWCLRASPTSPSCVTSGGASKSLSFFISAPLVAAHFNTTAPLDKLPLIASTMLHKLRNLHDRSEEDEPDAEYLFTYSDGASDVEFLEIDTPPPEFLKVGRLNLRSTCGGWPSRLGGQVCSQDSDCLGNTSHPFGFEMYYPDVLEPSFMPCRFSPSDAPSEFEKCRCCGSQGGALKGSTCSIYSQCGVNSATGEELTSCGCTLSRDPSGPNKYFPIPPLPPFPHSGFANGTRPTSPPLNINTYRGQNFRKCEPIFSLTPGSTGLTMFADVQYVGSKRISLVGPTNLINQAIASVTYSPDKNFNSLYRPNPIPRGFDLNAPFYAPIDFVFNDNGNSGGYLREPKSTVFTVKVLVAPVNDPPSMSDNIPGQVCVESSFISASFTVSDEDIKDHLAVSFTYNVNISVLHGSLSVDFAAFKKSSDILLRSPRNLIFQGTLKIINTILERVQYSPDDLYHTDSLDPERMILRVTDNKGNLDLKPERVTGFQKLIAISSVNNPPAIGRCSASTGLISRHTPGCPSTHSRFVQGLNATNTTISVVEDLWDEKLRRYEPFFWINSSFMLISDPDSSEARNVVPKLLKVDKSLSNNFTSDYYGSIFVELEVRHGNISVIPKPPVKLSHAIRFFYPNCTFSQRKNSCVICGSPVSSFADIIDECAIGRRVVFETQHESLIQGATKRQVQLIRYNPDKFFNGADSMKIVVSDQGFYSRTGVVHVVNDTLAIRVLSYNNVPVFVQPYNGRDSSVMNYQKGLVCNESYCEQFSSSRFPSGSYPPFKLLDQDLFESLNASSNVRALLAAAPQGLIRVSFLTEQNSLGTGRIVCRNCSTVSTQRTLISGSTTFNSFQIEGFYSDVNSAMEYLFYDAHPSFTGYEEIIVIIDDFGGVGEIQPKDDYKLGKASIDVVVGGMRACDVHKTCLSCKSSIKCGWCPSTCGGAGACLDGPSVPKYTTCPPHPIDGRVYNQCTVQFPDAIEVLIAVAAAAVGGSFIAYHFFMFVNRKHKDLSSFLKKKKLDASALGSRLYLLPPEAAIWSQFLAAVVFVAAFFLLVQNFAGLAVFRVEPDPFNDFFIPSAASISIAMDNCHVKIINAEAYFGPRAIKDNDDPLPGILLRFNVLKDENVVFQQLGCVSDRSQFVIVNNRINSSKYIGYHCHIELVVPPRFVLPTLIFTATGSNVSYIRGGPLDDYVNNFTDFSFGPNSLYMYGNNLQARFKGIRKVKHVVYETYNGLLSMDDVSFVTAKLNSTFGDIIVSTPSSCDTKYLQKSRNDVCLSFFQSSVQRECYPSVFYPSLVLNPPEACPVGVDCSNQETLFKALCELSSDCTAKNGVCDDGGLCTFDECTGLYSGSIISQPGQQFKQPSNIELFSAFGILSLSSVHPSLPLKDVFVNKKVEGKDIDMNQNDHAALHEQFHPGGGTRPIQDWWTLFVTGAGVLDASEGTFVWLSNDRYLTLSPALLDIVSLGLLSPDRGKSQSNLQPGFCPPVPSSNDEKTSRIIALYKLLRRKLELTPDLKEVKLPPGSLIAFINTTSGIKNIFSIDPLTNADIIKVAEPGDNPFLLLLIYLGVYVVPILFSVVFVSSLAWKYHLGVIEKRIKMYRHDMVAKQMLLTPDVAEADIEAELEDTRWDNSNLKMNEIYGKVGPFYMLDEYVDSAERQKSVLKLIAESVRHVLVIAAPTALVLLFASSYQNSQLIHMCEFRVDRARCMATPSPLVDIIFYVVAAYVAAAFLELMGYYLRLGFNIVRSLIRIAFLFGYFLMLTAACTYLVILMLWCIIGVLISPYKLAPYATALVCFIVHAATVFGTLRATQLSVRRTVCRRVAQHSSRLQGLIYPSVLEIILSNNVDQALHDAGYSLSKVFVSLIFSCVVLLLVDLCLFFGFSSFSDPRDGVASIVNCCLVVGAAVAINRSETGASGDRTSASTEKAARMISEQVKDVLDMVASQIKTGLKLMHTMQRLQSDDGEF